jgi:hypothetical protein
VRALRQANGVIPRAFPDSRRRVARVYRQYCVSIQKAWGPLPDIALPTLREAGRTVVELERLSSELERALARKRVTLVRRIRRSQLITRRSLWRLEQRLERFAPTHEQDIASQFARLHQRREVG